MPMSTRVKKKIGAGLATCAAIFGALALVGLVLLIASGFGAPVGFALLAGAVPSAVAIAVTAGSGGALLGGAVLGGVADKVMSDVRVEEALQAVQVNPGLQQLAANNGPAAAIGQENEILRGEIEEVLKKNITLREERVECKLERLEAVLELSRSEAASDPAQKQKKTGRCQDVGRLYSTGTMAGRARLNLLNSSVGSSDADYALGSESNEECAAADDRRHCLS